MTGAAEQEQDRRRRRTRKAVFDAFVRLVFQRRYDAIRTADLIEAAGIGRSTFYEHFRNKDDVLVAAFEPLFVPLADAAAGRGAEARLRMVLEHIWEQRGLGRLIFEPALLVKLQRRLAAMIDAQLEPGSRDGLPPALLAAGAAAGQMAMLRSWILGEVSCPAATLARHLAEAGRTLALSRTDPGDRVPAEQGADRPA